MKRIIISGGGLAGLLAAVALARKNIPTVVVERKLYPFHKVCGEYISNEVVPYLKSLEIYPEKFDPPQIKRFQLSSVTGKSAVMPLDMGGFGISRFSFDHFLFEQAIKLGVTFMLETAVEDVTYNNDVFHVVAGGKTLEADLVIGAYGKRSRLDAHFDRSFFQKRSPYVGVKYHIKASVPDDLIALHNFNSGYCGISQVEGGVVNLCYLAHRDLVRTVGSIAAFEKEIMCKNPLLADVLTNAEFLFSKPLVINEISFASKEPVTHHVLMAGDAAGMIAPLCGNGMAMAIHSAKILSEEVYKYCKNKSYTRDLLEKNYTHRWKRTFSARLRRGRYIQHLFGSRIASNLAVNLVLHMKPLANSIVKQSHGEFILD